MSTNTTTTTTTDPPAPSTRTSTYLVGINVTHSIAPPMHDYVASSLSLPWTFRATECPTVDDAMRLFRAPSFAGGVVTMPYKVSIMQHLDGLDYHARLLKACNNVYRDREGRLRGTNTDWRGIWGCLASARGDGKGCEEGRGRPGLIVGAGGAARAAVYALVKEVGCRPVYVVNRDGDEVRALVEDAGEYGEEAELVHLRTEEEARGLLEGRGWPVYMVGTVPDFEPKSVAEVECARILEMVLAGPVKGVVLDMCFKPRRTRTLKLAERYGWVGVEGTNVIGHQIHEQYRLWCAGEGEPSPITSEIQAGAWKVLNEAAEASTAIN
jgi:quinate dehydrogenase